MARTLTCTVLFFVAVLSRIQSQWIKHGDYEYFQWGLDPSYVLQAWHTARHMCQIKGGDLVSITSDAEYQFVVEEVTNSNFKGIVWIGLNYLDMTTWKWSDGETVEASYWAEGFPTQIPKDQGERHLCAYHSAHDNKWHNDHCEQAGGFICKRKPNQEGPITDSPTPSVGGYCPGGYFTSGEENNKCYKVVQVEDISTQGFDFQQAQAHCRDGPGFNPDLVSIHSPMENALLLTQIRRNGYGFWIGLYTNDPAGTFKYRWSDNSATGYSNWALSKPSHGGGQCTELFLRNKYDDVGKWSNLDCNHQRGYICQTFKTSDGYIATPPPTTPNVCRSDYTPFWYGCYKLVQDSPKTWDEARQHCRNEGGDLVSIQTSPENSAIFVKLAELSLDVWIGLRDLEQNGLYTWSNNWIVTYSNWGPNQPSDLTNGGCVSMRPDGEWYNNMCTNEKPFLCEISTVESVTAPPDLPGYCPGEQNGDKSWIHYGQFCYLFKQVGYEGVTWKDANMKCIHHAPMAHLVSIHDPSENNFIVKTMSDLNFQSSTWIGMYRSRKGRQWHWVDNSLVQYENWGPGEPNGNTSLDDCAELVLTGAVPGKWNDTSCDATDMHYICKSPKIPMETAPPTLEGTCPDGWVPYGSKCYMFQPNVHVDWQTAQDNCMSQGGSEATLVSLHSTFDSEFIHEAMMERSEVPDPYPYWLGMVKNGSLRAGHEFYWVDGSPVDYKLWNVGEPNDAGGIENCVHAQALDMKWNDLYCNHRKAYACQVEMEDAKQKGNGLSAGEIVAIIFGVLAIVVLLAALAVVILDKFQVINLSKVQGDSQVFFKNSEVSYERKDSDTDA